MAAVRYSPDSRVLVGESVQRPQQVHLLRWDAGSDGQLGPGAALPGRDTGLVALTAPDRALTSSLGDHASVLRDAGTGRALRRYAVSGPVAAADPSGRLAVFGAADGTVRVLDLHSGALHALRQGHAAAITAMCFSRTPAACSPRRSTASCSCGTSAAPPAWRYCAPTARGSLRRWRWPPTGGRPTRRAATAG